MPHCLPLSLSALLPFLGPWAPAATLQSLSTHSRLQPFLQNEILAREARWMRMMKISLTDLCWRTGVHGWPKRTQPHTHQVLPVVSSANCARSGAIMLMIWSNIWGVLTMEASSCCAWLILAQEILLGRTPWNNISRINTIGISLTQSGTCGWWCKGPPHHELEVIIGFCHPHIQFFSHTLISIGSSIMHIWGILCLQYVSLILLYYYIDTYTYCCLPNIYLLS